MANDFTVCHPATLDDEVALEEFKVAMRDYAYGESALLSAWGWFLAGWRRRAARAQEAADCRTLIDSYQALVKSDPLCRVPCAQCGGSSVYTKRTCTGGCDAHGMQRVDVALAVLEAQARQKE